MIALNPEVGTLFFAIIFGFGFAIGSWIWNTLVSAVASRRAPPP